MKKLFTQVLMAVVMAVAGAISVSAEPIHGYFRVQNLAGVADEYGYVQVRGPFTAEPDQTFDQAKSEAGTVMLIHAEPVVKNGQELYRIDNLRCQGIEVVGDVLDDYVEKIQEIMMASDDLTSRKAALWTLVRGGFKYGYTAVGRALLESMIYMVAVRLDQENVEGKEANELAQFTNRFKREVADQIDLHIYLEPTEAGYRLLYDVPDLQIVSDWYLKEENKATFEKGFEAMRMYMSDKLNGDTGEHLDPSEIAEMQSWGYDPTIKHTTYDENHLYIPYEEIFADHELLFNWLKLNMIKFTDEERCPKIEIQGFYLPDFAKEMKQHALTAQLISYFPRLKTNQRVYLTDGKNGVFGHLDFTSEEGAQALGEASQWVLRPVTADDDSFLFFKPMGYDRTTPYAAVYVDFPIKAADPTITKFYTFPNSTTSKVVYLGKDKYTVEYFDIEEIEGTIPAQTPVLVEMLDAPENCRILPDYELSLHLPAPDGFDVSDVIIGTQRAPQTRAAAPASHLQGVLLDTDLTAEDFHNKWYQSYDPQTTPVHRLTTRLVSDYNTLWYQEAEGTLPANEAVLLKSSSPVSGYAVKEPEASNPTGIEAIDADAQTADGATTVYDLQGRRVNSMVSGQIYIINGKKVFAL